MSFDLKVQDGDVVIGNNGDLLKIVDVEKLIQDILKILSTPMGANIFWPWYGSLLSSSAVGSDMDHQFMSTVVEEQIRTSLENIQNLQKEQLASGQSVSPQELLAAIQAVVVKRSIVDPTYFNIVVKVVNKAFQSVPVNFNVSL